MYYFEYPSLVSILMKDIRYGVEMNLAAVTINPFGAAAEGFEYHTGDINIALRAAATSSVSVPGAGLFQYVLHKMQAQASYEVVVQEGCSSSSKVGGVATAGGGGERQVVAASAEGVLSFTAPRGTDCALRITKLE
jgi:hypothetical protein